MPELGWALAGWAQGKGYATEALRAAIAWADAQIDSQRTVCIIRRENQRSLRVAERLGYDMVLQTPSDVEPDAILARATPKRT
jgi:RimJ/RimL family protein N-acetyltransferase